MSYIGVEKDTGAMHWLGSTPPEGGGGDMEIVYIPNTVAIDQVNAQLAQDQAKAASNQEKLRENLSFYLFTFYYEKTYHFISLHFQQLQKE